MICKELFIVGRKRCYCEHPELIENYDKAITDETQVWLCHHRLETHSSDGERRPVDISGSELIALGMYWNRPPEELIFLTEKEHRKLHNINPERNAKISKAHKGKKRVPLSEETKQKISASKIGKPSWNKGKSMSDETKEKLRQCNLGKKRDTSKYVQLNTKKEKYIDERAKKISKALKGKKKPAFSDEHKAKLAEVARQQRIDELNKIHMMGYKTKDELFEHFHCTKRTYKKVVPTEILETMVKFGKWNCYKF